MITQIAIAKVSLAAAVAILALSSTAPAVDGTVISVVTSGSWDRGDSRGSYRIIVWDVGFEHVSSGVVADWVADPTGPDADSTVVASHVLVEPSGVSFGQPQVQAIPKGLRVTLSGTRSSAPGLSISCVFELHPGGVVETIRGCA